jgi:hypothetical protein
MRIGILNSVHCLEKKVYYLIFIQIFYPLIDSEVKGKSEEFLEKIKSIEKEAKAAMEFRTELELLKR